MSSAFNSVAEFEARMAEFAGSKYGVAVASCTDALFLSFKYLKIQGQIVDVPARTYISVPAAIIHAGGKVRFVEREWNGAYRLEPFCVVDGAKRMRSSMYEGGLHCLSFHMKKLLPIGRGGMVLTNDEKTANWLRIARIDGRDASKPFIRDNVSVLGWNCYMTPEQASRGLHLLEGMRPDLPDLYDPYPDLRYMLAFKDNPDVVS